MKRKNTQIDNYVDGKQLKKIKKLMLQLDKDENEERELDLPKPVIENCSLPKNIESDEESEVSDVEPEVTYDDDNQTLDEQDNEALKNFLNPGIAKSVIEGLGEAKEEVDANMGIESKEFDINSIDGFKAHLETVIKLLKNYKKGRQFPKTVKVLPQLDKWFNVMDLLEFSSWSNAAVELITDQFKAKGGEAVEIYYRHYLTPFLREKIAENNRLDNVLYKVLCGTLFRRREFMSCILLPWCNDKLTGKEADILGNVLKNMTVKADVAGPAMTAIISQMPFCKETLIVLRALLEKKYNMAYQTIALFVDYFCQAGQPEKAAKLVTSDGRMPLLWYESLNLFASLYHVRLDEQATKRLFALCRIHHHDKVSEAIKAYLRMSPGFQAADSVAEMAVDH